MSENKNRYSRIKISEPRQLLKKRMDRFATFTWRGVNSFDKYGAFIINNKNSLKFYNGPSFTNEYSKPKFATAGNLVGISFSTKIIPLQIGAYWLTEKEYREFIHWLNPYEISYLGFDYEDKYDYLVKLSKVDEISTRYIVGYNENGEPCYYTELNLTFEVQGEACARARHAYEFKTTYSSTDSSELTLSFDNTKEDTYIESDLNFPFILETSFKAKQVADVIVKAILQKGTEQISLFDVSLQNLITAGSLWVNEDKVLVDAETIQTTYHLENTPNPVVNSDLGQELTNLKYDSEAGLLFLKVGEDSEKILSLVNTLNGMKLVNNFSVSKCKLPGRFTIPDVNLADYKIIITLTNAQFAQENPAQITAYARTNLI